MKTLAYKIRVNALITAALVLSGCASGPRPLGGDPRVSVVDASTLPSPTGVDLLTDSRPYLLGPFDKLTVDVFGIQGLEAKDVQVDAGGRISFPMVGSVEVAGKTSAEVERLFVERLRAAHIRDPQVTVNLKETISQVVTVDGQVNEPGQYPVIGRMTLMKAIARAKGTAEYAKLNDVVVFRTVEGQRYAALYNLQAVRRGAYADPDIFANDIIVVGDSTSRRLFKDLLQVVPLFTTPLIVTLQN